MIDIGKDLQSAYDDGEWDMFIRITSADYGKQRFFKQDDGSVYDRSEGIYFKTAEDAIKRYCAEICL